MTAPTQNDPGLEQDPVPTRQEQGSRRYGLEERFFEHVVQHRLAIIVLAIVLPISAYAAQKYAHLCYKELQALNRTMDQFTQRVLDEEG